MTPTAHSEKIEVPDMGDAGDVEVVEVLVSVGAEIEAEDSLITLESDKATMDVPSPKAGRVTDIKVKAGDQVSTGTVILMLEVAPEVAPEVVAEKDESPPAMEVARSPEPEAQAVEARPGPEGTTFASAYASPAVRRFARTLGVDLSRVRGSGRKGRIVKDDVEAFVRKSLQGPAEAGSSPGLPPMPVIDFSKFGEVERQPLSRIQKLSQASLHRSWLHVPHVTQHDEADITDLEAFRKQSAAEAKEAGYKLTPVAFLMKAAVAALQKYPWVNSSLDAEGEHVYLKKYYHLGVAVDTEQGLVVPVVRDVDRKSLFELAGELAEVSANARDRKLRPDQIQGASFTITSLGGIGGTAFTPIVNAPEVAILGVSRSRWKPVWNGEEFEPRLMLPISLSYDHRVVD